MRVMCSQEIFERFLSESKVLKGIVARDGIEPPTPAFSGPLTVSRKWFERIRESKKASLIETSNSSSYMSSLAVVSASFDRVA